MVLETNTIRGHYFHTKIILRNIYTGLKLEVIVKFCNNLNAQHLKHLRAFYTKNTSIFHFFINFWQFQGHRIPTYCGNVDFISAFRKYANIYLSNHAPHSTLMSQITEIIRIVLVNTVSTPCIFPMLKVNAYFYIKCKAQFLQLNIKRCRSYFTNL